MPKRDENYMRNQRDAIASAALEVLIEKGYHETTLRDICRAAGVSNGALYSYFPTREAVVVAACAIDHAKQAKADLPGSWEAYANLPEAQHRAVGAYGSKRFRLSLQFVAAISQMEDPPEGLPLIFEVYRDNIRRALLSFHARGLITLPLGIETTADLHCQLFVGAEYQLTANREYSSERVCAALKVGLALSAGMIEEPNAEWSRSEGEARQTVGS
ncbi:TetR/AcrR family transcriptional regulator [Sphingomonas mali]|uniref:TetR/AcrR family transcriptional regulator n=1 Tax=Sphingomonas mali TaxID=40682 RepID=UPI0008306507|nr:TetR/AcrR family transcriptional regulator [Sphingomonas mali]